MSTTRREILGVGAALAASSVAPMSAFAAVASVPAATAPKPLNILILGGTGLTGPHQVRYALARGHKLTLFNRGRRPKEWPASVEELTGDRETGDYSALKCLDAGSGKEIWTLTVPKLGNGKVGDWEYLGICSSPNPGAVGRRYKSESIGRSGAMCSKDPPGRMRNGRKPSSAPSATP